jgi:hypothetical protein
MLARLRPSLDAALLNFLAERRCHPKNDLLGNFWFVSHATNVTALNSETTHCLCLNSSHTY